MSQSFISFSQFMVLLKGLFLSYHLAVPCLVEQSRHDLDQVFPLEEEIVIFNYLLDSE